MRPARRESRQNRRRFVIVLLVLEITIVPVAIGQAIHGTSVVLPAAIMIGGCATIWGWRLRPM